MSERNTFQSAPHAETTTAISERLDATESGLATIEALARLTRFGRNELPMAPPTPAWKRFLRQFDNVFIYVLLISAFISVVLQHMVDAGVILAVVVINALVGFIQEGKAESALRSILSMTRTHCTVLRDGVQRSIDSAELVPGDVVTIQAGDRVPADLRLFYSKNLRCDESALTGESLAVDKTSEALPQDTPLAERTNMAYMGTIAVYGTGRGYVCNTGPRTEIGAISKLVQQTEMAPTPLQAQLGRFAKQLSVGILVLSVATLLFGVMVRDYTLANMFQAAIGIAVAAVPEGLPAIVTITLAIGVQRMARNKALVRRLPSVEVLGSVNVICSDKTGTLTTNTMTSREVVHSVHHYRVSGEGYRPDGDVAHRHDQSSLADDNDPLLHRAALIAMLCNDSSVREDDGEWQLTGDPTEGALLVLAMKLGYTRDGTERDWPRIDELPFATEKRYMATLHRGPGDYHLLAIKGAPDRLIGCATHQLGSNGPEPIDRDYWERMQDAMADGGMRVMALAQREVPAGTDKLLPDLAEREITLVALIGISDPPRAEAIDSISQCHSAGITVKMITGDSPVTASAIGRELGLKAGRVVTGAELDRMSDEELQDIVTTVDLFARASPANKLKLMEALQARNHIGAMTGDGVNDAPALRRADIGVAMGKKGTDAAKEAADIVLTDDNFQTIAKAVEEGRTVYDNILKSILFILPTSIAEASVIVIAILFGVVLPITPVQILWVNTVTAVTLSLALAFELPEADIMQRPPRPRGRGIVTPALLSRIFLVGLTSATVIFFLFSHFHTEVGVAFAQTVAVNMLVMIEAVYLINCRLLTGTVFNRAMLRGIWPSLLAIVAVILLQLGFTYLPISQRIFGLAPITLEAWIWIAVLTLPVLMMVEVEKLLWRHAAPTRSLAATDTVSG
ncbi:cation-translocating P-type ATPase [Gilvimarinus sp. F26214L]|uniref:cation-translocating P-type ATPase n=1 Tax=Gilvimarinus sp. DZF01 TaxID=3461371 RepID=UPI004045B056